MQHWTEYWSEEQLTCLPGEDNKDLNNCILSTWSVFAEQFRAQPELAVLDFACGNGLVTHTLYERLDEPYFTCIDAGVVDIKLPKKEALSLYSPLQISRNTDLNREFDIIASNFGAEYITAADCLHFISSHAKQGTVIALNMHSIESVISEVSKKASNAIQSWLNHSELNCLAAQLEAKFCVELAKKYINILFALNQDNDEIANTGLGLAVITMLSNYQKKISHVVCFEPLKKTYTLYLQRIEQQLRAAQNAQQIIDRVKRSSDFKIISFDAVSVRHKVISNFMVFTLNP